MRRILKFGCVRRKNDIAKQCELGVNQGRAVYRCDHRHFDIQMINQQVAAVMAGFVR
jgi:hypothetical protein